MKIKIVQTRSAGILTSASLAALAVCLFQPVAVRAQLVSLGAAGNYAVLEIGNGNVSIADAGNPLAGTITGNVGAAGGNLSDSNEPITGNVVLGTSASVNGSLASNVSGTVTVNSAAISAAVSAADAASAAAAALSSSGGGIGISSINLSNNITLNLNPGVYNLSSLVLQNGDVLNLAAGGSYVFNISGQFSLNSAEILAAAGLSPSQILFNDTGTQGVAFSGGLNNESILDGIILAPDASISLTPGVVDGEIISGGNINIASGASVQGVTGVPDTGSTALLLSIAGGIMLILRAITPGRSWRWTRVVASPGS